MKLTTRQISRLRKPKRYGDGGGLYLDIRASGFKTWVQRIVIDSKRVDRRLGTYPAMSLASARATASQNVVAVRNGDNPWSKSVSVTATDTPTVRDIANDVYAANSPAWSSAKTRNVWRQRLDKYILPAIGDMPIDTVTRSHVMDILLPIWHEKSETARRCRMILRMIMGYAVARDLCAFNVAGEGIDGALPRHRRRVIHMRAVDWRDVPMVYSQFRDSTASDIVKLMFAFQVLTATRPGETRNARWCDIDIERRVWTIPPSMMKSEREHRVPLSDAAMDIVDAAMDIRDDSGLVFPSPLTGTAISDAIVNKHLRALGIDATAHGFRSSFRDWAAENAESRELAEAALSHVVGGVEGAYFRSDLFDARRGLMHRYSDFVTLQPQPKTDTQRRSDSPRVWGMSDESN